LVLFCPVVLEEIIETYQFWIKIGTLHRNNNKIICTS
jgi:hypothetical protein